MPKSTQITFSTPYNFGDRVEFSSSNGSGKGAILDIVVCSNMEVYYIIENDNGYTNIGIYPEEISSLLDPSDVPASEAGKAFSAPDAGMPAGDKQPGIMPGPPRRQAKNPETPSS